MASFQPLAARTELILRRTVEKPDETQLRDLPKHP
jgi:hypothetical protein